MTEGSRLDLHVHSSYSPDSVLSIRSIVDMIGPRGLHGFALTDHNTSRGFAELRELARENPRYLIIPGFEVSTSDGHLLVLGISEAPPKNQPLGITLDWVRAQNGVAILAHPFRLSHGVGSRLASSAPVDGIETLNGHNSAVSNARAELVAARRGLASTGGSDAHLPADLGRSFTEFPEPPISIEDALQQIRHGHVQAGGRSATPRERVRTSFRAALLRLRRGLRPV
jgi:predicted metal-dependent phosphoesterase TrpH